MESKHMSQQVFAQYIEMSPASLSSIFNGRTKPTLNIVEAIKHKFPNINIDWLLFGTGDMYKTIGQESVVNEPSVTSSEPVLDFDAAQAPTPQCIGYDQPRSNISSAAREIVREEVKYIDKPQRRVMEIRVYYDDLTFESFVPSKK